MQAGRGGHIIAFQSVLPAVGPGALEQPGDQTSLYGTEKERNMFSPRHQAWRNIAEECSEEGIGVSMFLGMSKPIDIGSIGTYFSTFYPLSFLSNRHRYRIIYYWRRIVFPSSV